ncbi:hypothetical protein M707_23635 [Arthrobacter sp. AK-YN10]|nr:hypothetical protein M707_23635 [Arthrobacter sp. AK-YN10]
MVSCRRNRLSRRLDGPGNLGLTQRYDESTLLSCCLLRTYPDGVGRVADLCTAFDAEDSERVGPRCAAKWRFRGIPEGRLSLSMRSSSWRGYGGRGHGNACAVCILSQACSDFSRVRHRFRVIGCP